MAQAELQDFRAQTRAWLEQNCPEGIRGRGEGFAGGRKAPAPSAEFMKWFDRMHERGWTVPHWPKEYGGGGLGSEEALVLRQEMAELRAPAPLAGMGITMIGPTLLEHGNEEQRKRHLGKITSGEVRWCQGYSEPGAGSDLAGLQTKAEDKGDHYLVNGSKIWTSGAQYADWIFCLTRTNPDVPKHEGISFLLFSMDSEGVTVNPIVLISGESPFCQCFFDDVKVPKEDLVGQLDRGWTIAKRLLQHERAFISGFSSDAGARAPRERATSLETRAKDYVGEADGRIADAAVRRDVAKINMDARAFQLTQRRAHEENTEDATPTFVTSMFKLYGTELSKRRQESLVSIMGHQGIGWTGEGFTDREITATRTWLSDKAGTIGGGTSEVQMNIIAKRVLGLPD